MKRRSGGWRIRSRQNNSPLLRAHYRATDHAATARELAEARCTVLGASAFVNEDEIALGLLRNDQATKLILHFLDKIGRVLVPGDSIKGALVICGNPDEAGDTMDVPSHIENEAMDLCRAAFAAEGRFWS